MYNFTPKRPIKSFQDLEVYQKLLAVSVAVGRRIGTIDNRKLKIGVEDRESNFYIQPSIVKVALDLPVQIATAHSMRFTNKPKAIALLEEVMLGCNILIVYLEQYRDIENVPVPRLMGIDEEKGTKGNGSTTAVCNEIGTGAIEPEFFEQQIANLTTCRWKVMHLARSWEKFDNQVKT